MTWGLWLPCWTAQTRNTFINTGSSTEMCLPVGKTKVQGILVALLTLGVGGQRAMGGIHLRNALSRLWTSRARRWTRHNGGSEVNHQGEQKLPKAASTPHCWSGEWVSGSLLSDQRPQRRRRWPKLVSFLAKGSRSHFQVRNVTAPSCLSSGLGSTYTL